MTNRFVKSSIHFHVICNLMFDKLYDFTLLCFTLYNFCHFSIFFIFYNHLFIDVYACNSWCVRLSHLRGESDRVPACLQPPRQRSTEKPLPISHFLYPRLFILFLQPRIRSLGRAPSKRSSRLTAAARSFLRDFTIFILYLIYRHQIFCASSASARASLRAAAFSFSITAWKEKTSS
mgnify:CR=1 FL=1